MRIGLDMDETITRQPGFFSFLTNSAERKGWEIHIVTTRPDTPEDRERTQKDLTSLGIACRVVHHLPRRQGEVENCPYRELDSYQKFVWQKVKYCQEKNLDIFFDDDSVVIELFKQYAPGIQVFQVCKHDIGTTGG